MIPNFQKSPDGLLPVIVQDWKTREVLMLAYMNEESWCYTLESGCATYWSRSRQRLWKKGEESGHVQVVKEIRVDCDADTILLLVEQIGGVACHEGYASCFFRKYDPSSQDVVIVASRLVDPEKIYKKSNA